MGEAQKVGGTMQAPRRKTKMKKTKPVAFGDGLDKLFSKKVKYKSKAHQAKGSTWLKTPPKYGSQRAGGKCKKER